MRSALGPDLSISSGASCWKAWYHFDGKESPKWAVEEHWGQGGGLPGSGFRGLGELEAGGDMEGSDAGERMSDLIMEDRRR